MKCFMVPPRLGKEWNGCINTKLWTLSNEDGNANDDCSEKSHFWFALCFFVRVSRFCFLCFKLCEQKTGQCFSMKLNKYWKVFSYYVLVVRRTLKKVFQVPFLAKTPCRCSARCIPTCSYYSYYCSLPSSSSSLS